MCSDLITRSSSSIPNLWVCDSRSAAANTRRLISVSAFAFTGPMTSASGLPTMSSTAMPASFAAGSLAKVYRASPSTAAMTVGWLSVTTRKNVFRVSKRSAVVRNLSVDSFSRRTVPWRHTAMMVTVTATMSNTKTPNIVLSRVSVSPRASAQETLRTSIQGRLARDLETTSTSSPA